MDVRRWSYRLDNVQTLLFYSYEVYYSASKYIRFFRKVRLYRELINKMSLSIGLFFPLHFQLATHNCVIDLVHLLSTTYIIFFLIVFFSEAKKDLANGCMNLCKYTVSFDSWWLYFLFRYCLHWERSMTSSCLENLWRDGLIIKSWSGGFLDSFTILIAILLLGGHFPHFMKLDSLAFGTW